MWIRRVCIDSACGFTGRRARRIRMWIRRVSRLAVARKRKCGVALMDYAVSEGARSVRLYTIHATYRFIEINGKSTART
jgi:hypothetical protein